VSADLDRLPPPGDRKPGLRGATTGGPDTISGETKGIEIGEFILTTFLCVQARMVDIASVI